MLHLADGFKHAAALDQQPAPRAGGQRRCDRSWRGDHERAGAADEQKRESAIDPGVPRLLPEERRKHRHCQGHKADRRHVPARELIDEALGRRLGVRRLFHEFHHARDERVLGGLLHFDAQYGFRVDRTRQHRVAFGFRARHGFAGQRRLVHGRGSGNDDAIRRHAVTGPHGDNGAHRNALDRRLDETRRRLDHRRLGRDLRQGLDARAGAARRHALEKLADREQENDERRFFGGANDDGADDGNRHQHFDGEDRAGAESGKGPSGDGEGANRARGEEDKVRTVRQQIAFEIGEGDGQAGDDHQNAFRGLPPGAFDRLGVVRMILAIGIAVTVLPIV